MMLENWKHITTYLSLFGIIVICNKQNVVVQHSLQMNWKPAVCSVNVDDSMRLTSEESESPKGDLNGFQMAGCLLADQNEAAWFCAWLTLNLSVCAALAPPLPLYHNITAKLLIFYKLGVTVKIVYCF